MEDSDYIRNKDKTINDLERYEFIVDYFSKNINRVPQNRAYLVNIMDDVSKYITSIRFGYLKVKEGKDNFSLVKGLYTKIKSILDGAN
jgi:hypothetical protein